MSKYDIVFINANFSRGSENRHLCHPLGILYLGAILLTKGYKVKVLDFNMRPMSMEQIASELDGVEAPVFAISSLSGGYAFVKEIAPALKRRFPESTIILGGAINSGVAEYVMQKTGVDAAVEGEAETIIAQLLETILSGEDIAGTPGVYFKKDGVICRHAKNQEVVQDLDTLPFPAWDLIDAEGYIKNIIHGVHSENKRTFPVMASRGCPYGCHFCSRTLGGKLRTRGAGVAAEIETVIKKYGVEDILFIDEEFAISEKRAFEMCDNLEGLKIPVTFACSMRVDCVSPAILARMKKAGCRRIIYGVESGSDTILKKMNKGFTAAKAGEAIIETRKHGIEAYVNFMLGYPGETEETFRETVEFIKEHRLYSGFSITTPLPGSRLFEQCVASNLISDVDSYLTKFDRDMTSAFILNLTSIPDERLMELKTRAQEETFENRIILKS